MRTFGAQTRATIHACKNDCQPFFQPTPFHTAFSQHFGHFEDHFWPEQKFCTTHSKTFLHEMMSIHIVAMSLHVTPKFYQRYFFHHRSSPKVVLSCGRPGAAPGAPRDRRCAPQARADPGLEKSQTVAPFTRQATLRWASQPPLQAQSAEFGAVATPTGHRFQRRAYPRKAPGPRRPAARRGARGATLARL